MDISQSVSLEVLALLDWEGIELFQMNMTSSQSLKPLIIPLWEEGTGAQPNEC